jgi:LysR family transcriptional regulator, glycine cleavage system transcriptional activator
MRKARFRPLPMATLEAFEAAARSGSFSAAAMELSLTPGAISRQMAVLERDLGVVLFNRGARGVELTSAGRRLQLAASEALAIILSATRDLRRPGSSGMIRVSVTPSFGARWLLPRLSAFRATYPRIDVTPVADNRLVDLRREGYDMVVRYMSGSAPSGLQKISWLLEELVPVAAPAVMKGRAHTVDSLAGLPFLHDTSDELWRVWLSSVGKPDLLPPHGTVFNDYNLAVEAAVSGLGVLIGRTALIQDELRSGRLIESVPLRVPSPRTYCLLRPIGRAPPAVAAFWNWLQSHTSAEV